MMQFVGAHKVALLLIGALLGGVVLMHRRAGADNSSSIPNGVPTDAYASGLGFNPWDLASLLSPPGPAAPIDTTADNTSDPAPSAVTQTTNTSAQHAESIASTANSGPDYTVDAGVSTIHWFGPGGSGVAVGTQPTVAVPRYTGGGTAVAN